MKKRNKEKLQDIFDKYINNNLNENMTATEIIDIKFRLGQLECSHKNVSFYIENHGIGYPYCYGNSTLNHLADRMKK